MKETSLNNNTMSRSFEKFIVRSGSVYMKANGSNISLPWWQKIYQVFVCVEVLRPSQPNGVMSSAVSLPNHTFTGQA